MELIPAPTDQDLMKVAPRADVAIPFMQKIDADFIRAASNLRLIVQYGVGLEGVDVEEATCQGIAVSNVPACTSGNAQATAEHALLLSLSLLRQSNTELPRRFQSRELGGLPLPRSLHGKNVTVVGYGAVGSVLCKYLVVMGANVTAVRRQWKDEISLPIRKSTCLKEDLPSAELLILACTTTPETFHLINHETVALLPPNALIVNVGRGPLVEHGAILQGLRSGALSGFASDVGVSHPEKPSEPWDPDDELSLHPNALFTPHVGGYVDTSYERMAESIVDAMHHVVQGKPPPVWVNCPEEIERTTLLANSMA
jgi:phosphoglycerate dehydrogenase-like enzyme